MNLQVDLFGAKPHNRTSYWLARAMGVLWAWNKGVYAALSEVSQMKMQTGWGPGVPRLQLILLLLEEKNCS